MLNFVKLLLKYINYYYIYLCNCNKMRIKHIHTLQY